MTFDRETLKPTYQMVIGEAGESCAFYIADRLGMPNEMLRVAIRAAYGEEAVKAYEFQKEDLPLKKKKISKIVKAGKPNDNKALLETFLFFLCIQHSACMYVCVCVCVCARPHVCARAHVHVFCMYVCMYACMHVCMYVQACPLVSLIVVH